MATADAACARLCDPQAEVSSHYLIDRDGTQRSLVAEDNRAWHAGKGRWGDIADINSASIGIELDNDGQDAFAQPLMQSLERLLGDINQRHNIPPERVIGHSDCAIGRKVDPGPLFDWQRLAAAGLAIATDPARHRTKGRVYASGFYSDLAAIGYDSRARRSAQLAAFRLRHAPEHAGRFNQRDAQIARDLAQRYPVDRRLR